MKMNKIRLLSLFIGLISAFTACEKEGELITISGLEANDLQASESDVIITQENNEQLVLTLSWNQSTLSISDTSMSVPDLITSILEASTTNNFSENVASTTQTGLSKTFTGAELNTLAKNLGAQAAQSTPVYFRLKASTGNNMEPVFSNVVSVNITPFEIDMSRGFILNADQEDTGIYLYSASSDGKYSGFVGATSWFNFFLLEGDGTLWGNNAVSEVPFELSSDEGRWNCWFPGLSGCYYVDFDTNNLLWSALLIPTLTVSGDVSGEMNFDRANNKWLLSFNATATSLNIQVNGTGKLYNVTTNTDDALAIDMPVAFVQNGEYIGLNSQASNIAVTVPSLGEYTLTIDLSNPTALTCTAESGTDEPEEINPLLYLPGIDDGSSGSWNFDNILSLYNEEDLAYSGVVNVNSLWGYNINIEKDNWDDAYFLGEGDAYAGTLLFKGSNNLPAPDPGLYLIDVSLKALSYQLIEVGNEIYVSGLDDIWDFSTVLTATETPGIYSGTITFAGASPWGFQIHLNDSWNNYYGGANGKLNYKGSNITDDANLSAGSYTLTVDLINANYEISQ